MLEKYSGGNTGTNAISQLIRRLATAFSVMGLFTTTSLYNFAELSVARVIYTLDLQTGRLRS